MDEVMWMAVKKTNKLTVSEPEKIERLFSKEQLLTAERFQDRKDIVNALLSDDKQYTVESVEQKITKYMKGLVK